MLYTRCCVPMYVHIFIMYIRKYTSSQGITQSEEFRQVPRGWGNFSKKWSEANLPFLFVINFFSINKERNRIQCEQQYRRFISRILFIPFFFLIFPEMLSWSGKRTGMCMKEKKTRKTALRERERERENINKTNLFRCSLFLSIFSIRFSFYV